VAARCLPDFQAKIARCARQAAEDTRATGPFYCVCGGDLKIGASFYGARRCGAGDGGEERGEVGGHVGVEGVKGMGVGDFDQLDGYFLVGFSGGGVNTGKPGSGFRAVADVAGIDIKGGQVAFSIRKVVRGYMRDDDAVGIGWDGSNCEVLGKAEEEYGDDGRGNHF
jgi:hypothetical protein